MTELLCLSDAYLQTFEAHVVGQLEGGVVLNRTAFYPGGGGQLCDVGVLMANGRSFAVNKVRKMKGTPVHFLADGELLDGETVVSGQIDWERRYQLMRTHTAMHILCGVVWRDYGAQVTGGNMDLLKGRMDFEFETMRQELVAEIETAVNKEVVAARDVKVNVLPRDEAFQIPDLIRTKINLLPPMITEIRTIELKGLDLQADGGTHVKNTSEVGEIKIVNYKSKGKINKRIYVELTQ